MARALAFALLLAAAGVGCGGEPAPSPLSGTAAPSSTATSLTTAPPMSESPSATPEPPIEDDVHLPRHAPTSLADDVPPDRLGPQALAPPGAAIGSSWASGDETGPGAVAFTWTRGDDPLAAETGFEVWVRSEGETPAWRVMYAFTDGPRSGVLGIRFDEGDVTGDGLPDVVTFEDIGGSGACGTWRVIRIDGIDATETFARQTCDTDVRIVAGDLESRAAVFAPGDAHCCPSAYRITRLHWTGGSWKVVDRATEPT